jgi:VWFA-related protein
MQSVSAALNKFLSPPSAVSNFSRSIIIAIAGLLLLVVVPRQVAAQEPEDDGDVVRVSTELLLFPIRIKDKRGQIVSGLTEKDLSLKDQDGITKGIYLAPGAERVALVFALDQSGSLQQIIKQQRDAAIGLFEHFGPRSSVAVIRFSEVPKLVAPFNRDPDVARTAFDFRAATNQHTAIFDAADIAVSTFDSLPRARAERRIVILISDGLDNVSRTRPDTVVDLANQKQVSFYVIHLPLYTPIGGRIGIRPPAKGFKELAEKTGGRYFVATSPNPLLGAQDYNLSPIFQAIEDDLKSQYLLGFYINESSKDGKTHSLSVTLLPRDAEYSVGQLKFSKTQKFSVDLAPKTQHP